MKVRIEELPKKILIGKSLKMSLVNNKTPQLWKSFMTEKSAIDNTIGTNLYSIQVYHDVHYFENFKPETEFTKWAAIEVEDHNTIPIGFTPFILESGRYAVFSHKGDAIEFQKSMQYIFGVWMPQSEFELDDRPHFELLGEKYKNNSPDSEEEIWLPVRKRT